MKKPSKPGGFTLIELLIVIGIIALLATIILASLAASRAKADDSRRQASLRNIQTQVADTTNVGQTGYTTVFTSGFAAQKLQQLASLSNITAGEYDVRADQTSYVVVFPLREGGYWCIDANNVAKKVDGRLSASGANNCENILVSGAVGGADITLAGANPDTVHVVNDCGDYIVDGRYGSGYTEAGYAAVDPVDGNITAQVLKSPITLTFSDPAGDPDGGSIQYSVTDSRSITTTVTRMLIPSIATVGGCGGASPF